MFCSLFEKLVSSNHLQPLEISLTLRRRPAQCDLSNLASCPKLSLNDGVGHSMIRERAVEDKSEGSQFLPFVHLPGWLLQP